MTNNIIIATIFFVGVQVYLWYHGRNNKQGTSIAVLRLLLGLLFATAALTTQIMAYNLASEYVQYLGLGESWARYIPISVSLLLGGTLDVAAVALWPTTIKLGINIAEKKRRENPLMLREVYSFRYFLTLTVLLTLCSMTLSYLSPSVVVDGIQADTEDEVEVVEKYTTVVDSRLSLLDKSIQGLEKQKESVLNRIQRTYPQWYEQATVDSSAYYVRWLNGKMKEENYDDLEEQIRELESKKAEVASLSVEEGNKVVQDTRKSNKKKELSAAKRRTIMLYTLRFVGPGSSLATIFIIWGMVLLGAYNKLSLRDKGTSFTYVQEGGKPVIQYASRPRRWTGVFPTRPTERVPPEDGEDKEETIHLKWDEDKEKVMYLHTLEGGPNVGSQVWKDLKWVRHQLAQNKSRLKGKEKERSRNQDVDTSTLEENILRWEAIIEMMLGEKTKH